MDIKTVEKLINENVNAGGKAKTDSGHEISFETEEVVFQAEKMIFQALQKFHTDFQIDESDIKINSKLASAVIKKHMNFNKISIETLFAVHTVTMLYQPVMKIIETKKTESDE